MAMKKPILLLVVLCVLILPVTAYTTSYTAPDDKAIWGIDFDAPYGSTGDITLTLEDGSVVEGSWSYTGFAPLTASVDLEGETATHEYWIAIPVPLKIAVWNGDNSSYSREIKLGYGQATGIWNDVVTTSILNSPTVGYTIVSSQPVTVVNELKDRETARKQLSAGDPYEGSILDMLFEQMDTIMAIFFGSAYWIKFLFVDHLILTVSLYFAGSMAYAINTSRNIFAFYKTFFRQQKAMFEFIVNIASLTVSLVAQIGGLAISGAGSILGKIIHLFI
jgi:hypothetical protein